MFISLTIFTVLPFGLSTRTSPLTKLVGQLIKYWRLHAGRIAFFFLESLYSYDAPRLFMYSNVSDTSSASIYEDNSKLNICTKKLNFIGETKSSTWRELKWHRDKYASSITAKSESNKIELYS